MRAGAICVGLAVRAPRHEQCTARGVNRLAEELKRRTAQFSDDIVALCEGLPDRPEAAREIKKQLQRAALAVGSGYRAVCSARSADDFIDKIGKVAEESDECLYWIDRLVTSRLVAADAAARYRDEANQLTAIFVASKNTSRRNALRNKRRARGL